jgi:hypothetical protein
LDQPIAGSRARAASDIRPVRSGDESAPQIEQVAQQSSDFLQFDRRGPAPLAPIKECATEDDNNLELLRTRVRNVTDPFIR